VPGASIAATLALFVLVYGVVFAMGIYYINRLIAKGPEGGAVEPSTPQAPRRPLASAADAVREALKPTATGAGG
jgi:cytochrome d ubiquinol oxidase subunit I